MIKLLKKEMRLSASVLSYLFIAFGLITFCPGYPILVGTFFACLGLFQSFQSARESNDITYTALLPVAKRDIVKAKYFFCIFIEMCYFLLAAVSTLIRMTALSNAPVYRQNALMNANLAYLGFVLLIFASFNGIFVCGFFKTAYKFAKPFVKFIIIAFLIVGASETLVHIPRLEVINAFGFENIAVQGGIFAGGLAIFVLSAFYSMNKAVKYFEIIDL